jgi:hypothetical protein
VTSRRATLSNFRLFSREIRTTCRTNPKSNESCPPQAVGKPIVQSSGRPAIKDHADRIAPHVKQAVPNINADHDTVCNNDLRSASAGFASSAETPMEMCHAFELACG